MSPVVSTSSIVSLAIYLAKVEINYKMQFTGLAFSAFIPYLPVRDLGSCWLSILAYFAFMSLRALVHQSGCDFSRTVWSCAVTRILLLRCTCCFRSQPLQYVESFVKSLTVSISRHSGHFMHALHLSCRSSFICW